MKKLSYLLTIALFGAASFEMTAQMTDSQIINYARQNISSGKSKTQVFNELQSRGVSQEQLTRVGATAGLTDFTLKEADDSLESGQSRLRATTSDSTTLAETPSLLYQVPSSEIFGQDFFFNPMLSFEPNENAATPSDYVLGPEDQLIIDVWGENEASIKATISPEGKINIRNVGPVYLSGLTIKQATSKLKKALSAKYSLSGEDSNSQMSITLGNVRSIKVNIVGEVRVPGTYRVSSLSTVFNALFRAGGMSEIGSVRNIKLSRNGQIVSTIDLYKYLFDGDNKVNMPLKEGDLIIVPAYSAVVDVKEGFRRLKKYELVSGETIDKVVAYAGGFAAGAYSGDVTIQRLEGEGGKTFTIESASFKKFALKDGDVLFSHLNANEDLFANQVTVEGAVLRPGIYALGGSIASLRQLVEKAGGLLDNALKTRAQIVREKKDRTIETISVAIGAIMDGSAQDIILCRNDKLIVSDILEVEKKGDVTITGFVNEPGDYPYEENMSVEDLILKAGGLVSGASHARVDISRVNYDANTSTPVDTLAKVFSISLKYGLPVEGTPSFTLNPHDIVSVRKSPSFVNQKQVTISGEVLFPGAYTLVTNNDRLSSLYKRAGGADTHAYLAGATLKRKYTDEELEIRKQMATVAVSQIDSANIKKVSESDTYYVGIDLAKAIAKPGSDYDITLCEGDELIVPCISNTVRILGEVLYPNSVSYVKGKGVGYYIEQAGGYSNDAKRANVYVVHMNGNVDRGLFAPVYPGSEIMVPAKKPRREITMAEVISIGTASATLCTIVITLINMLRK